MTVRPVLRHGLVAFTVKGAASCIMYYVEPGEQRRDRPFIALEVARG
jgi:hypothetical protein